MSVVHKYASVEFTQNIIGAQPRRLKGKGVFLEKERGRESRFNVRQGKRRKRGEPAFALQRSVRRSASGMCHCGCGLSESHPKEDMSERCLALTASQSRWGRAGQLMVSANTAAAFYDTSHNGFILSAVQ